MAGSNQTKLKILHLLKIFNEQTDENNPMTVNDLINELSKNDISAERKSVYADIDILKNFEVDICEVNSKTFGYFIGERDFEVVELKLLIDSVQSANFISADKSNKLIKKIEGLTSKQNAKLLQSQVVIDGRIKCQNEEIYYNIDKLNTAIIKKKKISFQYYEYDINKKQILKNSGLEYIVSPYALSYNNDNYYLIGNYNKYDNLSHYRIDRMCNMIVMEENSRDFSELGLHKNDLNVAEYSKKIYNMFSGTSEVVEIRFCNNLINAVIDKFGTAIPIIKKTQKHFEISIDTIVSEGFISWILIFGADAEVIKPITLRECIKKRAESIYNLYK